MGRGNPYTQLGLGTCGHVVGTWPQITDIGGGNPLVVCEECTRQNYSLSGDETFLWVKLAPEKSVGIPKPPKPKREKKPKPLTPWQTLLQEEGLF